MSQQNHSNITAISKLSNITAKSQPNHSRITVVEEPVIAFEEEPVIAVIAFVFNPEDRCLLYGDGEGKRLHRLRRCRHRGEQHKLETATVEINFKGQLISQWWKSKRPINRFIKKEIEQNHFGRINFAESSKRESEDRDFFKGVMAISSRESVEINFAGERSNGEEEIDATEGRWWADGAINGEEESEGESNGEVMAEEIRFHEKNGKDCSACLF
ncbi:hypothetical protein LXL04_009400 [Taraxacum kok-saghyz]